MQNEMFSTLAFLLSLLNRQDIVPIIELQSSLKNLEKNNPKKIDLSLELAIGLFKFFSIQIINFVTAGKLTKEQADLSLSALNELFDGNQWWYKNRFLIEYPGKEADLTLRELFSSLLIAADYYDQSPEGVIKNLSDKEQRAFIMLLGLSNQELYPLEKVARELKMTNERVRQTKVKVRRMILQNATKKEIKITFLND